jgi:ComF family protein
LKYRPNRDLAEIMALWLFDLLTQVRWRPTLILPVPLGKRRLRSRGYNQAGLIAEAFASYLDLEINEDLLFRIRETTSQVGLDPLSREKNVHAAFAVDKEIESNNKVLLVDDLVTTGATLSACARALFHAGAQKVYGISVARA